MGIINARILPQAVTVATTATALPTTALAGRKSILIQNAGSATMYLGGSTVTTSNGILLAAGLSLPFDIGEAVTIYAIVADGTQEARILEGA